MRSPTEETQAYLRFTGREAEITLYNLIVDVCLDDIVLQYILPDGQPHSFETSLWDYKKSLPNTSGRINSEDALSNQIAIADLVKDVVAFHNSFGGYLLAGIDEHTENAICGCTNLDANGFTVEKLNEQVFSYTKTKINCRFRKIAIPHRDNSIKELGLLVIPMREADKTPVRMARGAPEEKNRSKFEKGAIFARIDDSCLPVHNNSQGLRFVCSERQFNVRHQTRQIEHNLPLPDPNLTRFVGRSEYLYNLWSWLTEKHNPVKIITALGGTGKTAIAYEFCLQFLTSPPAWAQKLIWLSAKKQSFLAFMGTFSKTTRTDFDNVNSCLSAIAKELGAVDEEILIAQSDINDLLDLAFTGLMSFPALIVIDDIDTLELAEQENLFSTIQSLAGQAFLGGSRFLITSRLEFGAESQRIKLSGFPELEFKEYLDEQKRQYNVTIPTATVSSLYRASQGSPIFCSSIIRLASLGMEIHAAIKAWKGKQGETVRRFAFEEEIKKLTDTQSRVLYALSTLGETNFLELRQVLEVDSPILLEDLSALRKFHLYASGGDPRTGNRLMVPEPIRLMRDILEEHITDPKRIQRECARARSNSPRLKDQVSLNMASILALWKENNYEDALAFAVDAAKNNKKNADIFCALGQCYMKVTPARHSEADKAFQEANRLSSTRPELIPNWLEAKRNLGDWAGVLDVASRIPPADLRGEASLIYVEALAHLGAQAIARRDSIRATERFSEAMKVASRVIAQGRAGDRIISVREICRGSALRYVSIVDEENQRSGDRLNVFNAVVDAYECHVTETGIIKLGANALHQWAEEALQRKSGRHEVLSILSKRLDKFQQIVDHLQGQEKPRFRLIEELTCIAKNLRVSLNCSGRI